MSRLAGPPISSFGRFRVRGPERLGVASPEPPERRSTAFGVAGPFVLGGIVFLAGAIVIGR
ncbi:hypothetical protein BH20CHL7_BH20CHL7_01410 [soil metagenome]